MRLARFIAVLVAVGVIGNTAIAQIPDETEACSMELRADNATNHSLSQAMVASIVSSAMSAREGLPCFTYARMVEAANSALSAYLVELGPRHPEALEAARNGRLLEARALYTGAVAAAENARTTSAASDLHEAALLALAASDFDDAARLLSRAADISRRGSEAHQLYLEERARALSHSADFYGDVSALDEALAIYRRLSIEISRADPRWAGIQASLALMVFTQADQTTDPSRRIAILDNAAALFRAVSEVRQSLPTPALWARTQFNLGLALVELGARRESRAGRADIEAAIAAYGNALAVYEPEKYPRFWGQIQSSLGIALMVLSAIESDPIRRKADLRDALQRFQSVADLRSRVVAPGDWAVAQHRISRAYLELAKLSNDPNDTLGLLRDAAVASRASLEVLSIDRSPTDWAVAQMNFGEILLTTPDADAAAIRDAIAAFEAARRVYTREADPHEWGRANLLIAIAHGRVAERGDHTHWALANAAAREALLAFEAAGADRDAQFARSFLQSFPAN